MNPRRWPASLLAGAVVFAALAALGHGPLTGSSADASGTFTTAALQQPDAPMSEAVSVLPAAAPRPMVTRPDERVDRLFRLASVAALLAAFVLVGRPRSTLHRVSDVLVTATQSFARRAPGRAPPTIAVH